MGATGRVWRGPENTAGGCRFLKGEGANPMFPTRTKSPLPTKSVSLLHPPPVTWGPPSPPQKGGCCLSTYPCSTCHGRNRAATHGGSVPAMLTSPTKWISKRGPSYKSLFIPLEMNPIQIKYVMIHLNKQSPRVSLQRAFFQGPHNNI